MSAPVTTPPPPPAGQPATTAATGFDYAAAYPLPAGVSQIVGHVVDDKGAPVAGATVRLAGTTQTTVSGADGAFTFSPLPTNASNPPAYPIFVTAPHLGTAEMQRVPLFDRQKVILTFTMPPAGQTASDPGFTLPAEQNAFLGSATGATKRPKPDPSSQTSPPPYIRVGINTTGGCVSSSYNFPTVDHVSFREYIKYVLPAEWYASWPAASLEAGAMTIKNYAWYWVNSGGKYANADLDNTACDEVYDPSKETSATDAAVDAVLSDGWYQNNTIAQAQYVSGEPASLEPCVDQDGDGDDSTSDNDGDQTCYPGRLSQWGTEELANDGDSYQQILQYYYATGSNAVTYFTVVPMAPEVYLTSWVPGSSATFSYQTPGTSWYQVDQWDPCTSSWVDEYNGSGTSYTASEICGNPSINVSVSAWDSAGWSAWSYNNGSIASNVTNDSSVPPPGTQGRDLSDEGFCLQLSDGDTNVNSYQLYWWNGSSWAYQLSVSAGNQAAGCPSGGTTVLIGGPAGSATSWEAFAADSSGHSSNGSAILAVTYPTGY